MPAEKILDVFWKIREQLRDSTIPTHEISLVAAILTSAAVNQMMLEENQHG